MLEELWCLKCRRPQSPIGGGGGRQPWPKEEQGELDGWCNAGLLTSRGFGGRSIADHGTLFVCHDRLEGLSPTSPLPYGESDPIWHLQ